ncbi:hypothetical protein RDABS01_024821 [Bienertia sinuspersici]
MKHLHNWGKGDPCASHWTGVLCFPQIGKDGIFHVQEIQLLSMNLSGTLAPEVGKLSHLEILDFMWNQLNGSIPKEIGDLLSLTLLLLNGNQFSGSLPDELGFLVNLDRLQVDENNLSGIIPKFYANMISIEHFHLNNNSFSGELPPEFSKLPKLVHLLLDNNNMSGNLPPEYSDLKQLEILSLRNCSLGGPVPDLSQMPYLRNIHLFCDSDAGGNGTSDGPTIPIDCSTACPTDQDYEPIPELPDCICAAPIKIGYRLKSPSFTYFPPYIFAFKSYITHTFNMDLYQLFIDSYEWEEGPRLRMYLKLFPDINNSRIFNESELLYIRHVYATWNFSGSDLFGPYELLNFTFFDSYIFVDLGNGDNGLSKGALAAIIVAAVTFAAITSVLATVLIMSWKNESQDLSRNNLFDGVKEFTFEEMSQATSNFNNSAQVGRGGYGKVYKGILSSSTIVAVKRVDEGSLQGKREFLTEIQCLSRLHHRNLVSLVGYCGEGGKREKTLNFVMRLRIALDAAKGILYLHTEADPPLFHRDIKASNILLDANLTAKVADFGISHLAPVMDDKGCVPHHISTVVKGTPGYLDPEYFLTHQLTDKSDVYSLGVVFLELLTGAPPISLGKNLVREVNAAQNSGSLFSIIDRRMGAYPSEYVERFISLAMRCCQDKPEMRPSMLDVVRELESMLQLLTESMAISDTNTSLQFRSFRTATPSTNVSKYTQMSYDVSGSDLTSTVFSAIKPR